MAAKKASKKKTAKKAAKKVVVKKKAAKKTAKKVAQKTSKVTAAKSKAKAAAKPKKSNPPTHDEISAAAFKLWEKKGCPQGQDSEIWHEAEQKLIKASKK